VLVSLKAFNALDKATQEAVLKAAADAQVRGWKISEDKENTFKQTLRDRGMTVEPPSATFAADLQKVGAVMLGDWEKKMGAEGAALISAYRK